MSAEKILELYILEHPDCWEYENEMIEVARLKELCIAESLTDKNLTSSYSV